MIRTCDGTDIYLEGQDGRPCRCGLTFDDVTRRVIYPHDQIVKLTEEQRDELLNAWLRNSARNLTT